MSNFTPNSPDFQQSRAPHLLEEPPILVYPTLAVYMGINKAVVFQQLHFLQNGQKTAKNEHNYIDGRYWVYNSYQQWKDQYFPWLSVSTLKGIFIELEDDDKLIMSRQSVKNKSDRRKWYSIDYEAWVSFCTTMRQKMSDGSLDKNSPMVGQEMSDGYSETSSETSTEKSTATPSVSKPKKETTDSSLITSYIKAWLDGLPIPPATNQYSNKTNRVIAKAISDAGYTTDQVTAYTRMLATDPYWRGKLVSFKYVGDGIAAAIGKATPPPSSAPPPPPPEAEQPRELTPDEAAARIAEYNRWMNLLLTSKVEKTVEAA